MLRTGQSLRPASHPASRPRTGASLPGTLASPQTGLAPAGHPQLVARLRHNNLLVVMAPKLLDALPERRVADVQNGGPGRSEHECRTGDPARHAAAVSRSEFVKHFPVGFRTQY
jgi:hypothetical protein